MELKKYKKKYNLRSTDVLKLILFWVKGAIRRSLRKQNMGVHLYEKEIGIQSVKINGQWKESSGYLDLSEEDVFQDAVLSCLQKTDPFDLQNEANKALDNAGKKQRRRLSNEASHKRNYYLAYSGQDRHDHDREIRIIEFKDELTKEEVMFVDAVIYGIDFRKERKIYCSYKSEVMEYSGLSERAFIRVRSQLQRKFSEDFYLVV